MDRIGKFEIVELLGRGAMGMVYKGHDPSLARHVAIKVMTAHLEMDPELRARFFREAQAAGSLQHPNIITVFELGDAGGQPFIAMEFIPGRDLDSIIDAREPLTIVEKVDLIEQVCRGLAYAHDREIIHRDVKPANIRVTEMGQVKLMDFGVAHLVSSELTQTGSVVGTPYYMAPEVISGKPIDSRADIFSLGATFYELLSYSRPFQGDSLQTVFTKILHSDPAPLREMGLDVPHLLQKVLDRSLAKNPDDRYADTGEFLNDLMRFWETVPASAQARAAAATSLGATAAKAAAAAKRRWTSRRWIPLAAGGAIIAAGLIIVGGAVIWPMFSTRTAGDGVAETVNATEIVSGEPGGAPESGVPAVGIVDTLTEAVAEDSGSGQPAAAEQVEEPPQERRVPIRQPAPVTASPRNTRSDPSRAARSAYESARVQTEEVRARALEVGAMRLAAAVFGRAESLRADAERQAAAGRHSDAVQSLNAAQTAYGSSQTTALSWRARLDSAWQTLASLQPAAREGAPEYAQAERLRKQALDAEQAGDPAAALVQIASAVEAYRLAAAPPPVEARPEPKPAAEEVVRATLAQLRRAIETKDLPALRQVWVDLSSEQVRGFESFFSEMRDLKVSFDVESVAEIGDRIEASVQTSYDYVSRSSGRETRRFPQVFEIAERGGRWVVIGVRG